MEKVFFIETYLECWMSSITQISNHIYLEFWTNFGKLIMS